MSFRPALSRITVSNLLSFGSGDTTLEFGPLSVLIGPNGSGKSNLIDAVGILQAAPSDIGLPIRNSGGIAEWIWKGSTGGQIASIEAVVNPWGSAPRVRLRYACSFTDRRQRFHLLGERIAYRGRVANESSPRVFFEFSEPDQKPQVRVGSSMQSLEEDYDLDQSALSQLKSIRDYREITSLGRVFGAFRFYRQYQFGRENVSARIPQSADLPNDFLDEDGTNLGLVLNNLQRDGNIERLLLRQLQAFYTGVEGIHINVEGGTVQVFLKEKRSEANGNERYYSIPATRMSDGTLHWLSMLAILLHPKPPPLVCIEEPEMGLHPDMMPVLAELLKDASTRMQLIVTTHSDALVDALSDTPESVVVCEKVNGATQMRRLDRENLKAWLERYTLGQLWRSGEIGGNRW